jgi:ABC-2 type transport system ATP-binding protein
MPTVAVSVNQLSKTYPVPFLRLKKLLRREFKPPVHALTDISFDIPEGQIFGLIGPNGAGKTTLTKIIATLIQPTAGSVSVKGHDTVDDDRHVRSQVGLAGAEERTFYWRLTPEQNLMFFARLHGLSSRNAKARIDKLFDSLELKDLTQRRFAELSTGNKQRLAVARAMLADPPVLLLDEPTRSLDPIAAARMRDTIKSLARANKTIFLTSHNLNEVEELCDRVAIISKGSVRALDTPQNLRATHTATERVTISFDRLSVINAEQALARTFGPTLATVEMSIRPNEAEVSFTRLANDDLLDQVLQVLKLSGGVIRSVESKRATLLDVLASYENDDSGKVAAFSPD